MLYRHMHDLISGERDNARKKKKHNVVAELSIVIKAIDKLDDTSTVFFIFLSGEKDSHI